MISPHFQPNLKTGLYACYSNSSVVTNLIYPDLIHLSIIFQKLFHTQQLFGQLENENGFSFLKEKAFPFLTFPNPSFSFQNPLDRIPFPDFFHVNLRLY